MDWNYDMKAALDQRHIQLGVQIFGCSFGDLAVMHFKDGAWINSATGKPFNPVGWIEAPPVNVSR